MGTKKELLYPTYRQNFDRLFHMIKKHKDTMGIEELHIFLFEKDIVWNKTPFNKYQKGILLSGLPTVNYKEEIQELFYEDSVLTLQHIEIQDYQFEEFLNRGRAYLIE